jgi:hypothetical protein
MAADEPEQKEVSIEQFMQSLSTIPGVMFRKDPFREVAPPFEIPSASSTLGENEGPTLGAPILERYAVAEYEVVAVLIGDKYPRALVRLPKEGTTQRVVIVKENDKLGNRKGVVAKITHEGLIVRQSQRAKSGFVDKTEVLLKVGGKADDQKRALLAAKQSAEAKGDVDKDGKK